MKALRSRLFLVVSVWLTLVSQAGAQVTPILAQAELQGTNVLITFNSNPPKWYIVQYSATLAPANWENLFAVPTQATNSIMSQLHTGGATSQQGYYRIAQFDSPPPGINLALVASDLTSYVSPWETLTAINNGFDPANSADHSHGAYGNWVGDGGNGTQWVEYDFSQPIITAKMDVYWWQDGAGIYAPAACRLKYWDGANFVLVQNSVGLGVALNQYNTTTFTTATSTKFRLEFDSDGTHSTGILQWKIYDTGATLNFAPVVVGDVDRDVVIGGITYLNGAVRDDGKMYATPQISWSALSGPGSVTFNNAVATNTTASLTGLGANVLQLTAFDGQYQSSNTVNVNVQPQFSTAHPLPLYVDKNTYTINSSLWKYRLSKNITNWIPHLYAELNATNNSVGNIFSFMQASNKLAGLLYSVPNADPYADAYTLNTVEAMCYALNYNAQGDPGILAAQANFRTNLAYWVPIILSAQQSDGYLHTYTTLRGLGRWTINTDHEGYVGGYFIEAGLAHYLMCERTNAILYNAAKKLADCWCNNLGPGKKVWFDGHENMEQALVHLGRFVNEYEGPTNGQKYINLAKWLVDCRGTVAANATEGDGADYDQSQAPVSHQYEIVGHGVRAEYLSSGVADVALETGNLDYQSTAMSLWDNFVNKKYYLTGGAGSGADFGRIWRQLRPAEQSSYCEPSAGCGTLFFFHKLNLANQDARYADEMENVLYNEILGGGGRPGPQHLLSQPALGRRPSAVQTGVPCCYGNFARTVMELLHLDLPAQLEFHLPQSVHRQHDEHSQRGRHHGADRAGHGISLDQHRPNHREPVRAGDVHALHSRTEPHHQHALHAHARHQRIDLHSPEWRAGVVHRHERLRGHHPHVDRGRLRGHRFADDRPAGQSHQQDCRGSGHGRPAIRPDYLQHRERRPNHRFGPESIRDVVHAIHEHPRRLPENHRHMVRWHHTAHRDPQLLTLESRRKFGCVVPGSMRGARPPRAR